MSLEKSDLTQGVVIKNSGSNYAYKLIEKSWVIVAGTHVVYWTVLPGNTRTGDFVASSDPETVSLLSEKYILESFNSKWVKDDRFKDGDFLISKGGDHVFLYRFGDGVEKVWKLNGGTATWQATLASREREYGTLSKLSRGWSDEHATIETLSAKLKRNN